MKKLLFLLLLFSPQVFAQVPFADPVIEMRLGRVWMKMASHEFRFSSNKLYLDTVQRVSSKLVDAVNDRPDLRDSWNFMVVETSEINAFSYTGGNVVINSGLLDAITKDGKVDEDMLAGVMGHEMAHVTHRHILATMRNSESLSWIVQNMDSISQAANSGRLSDDQSKKLYAISIARFSRDQEFDADKYGSFYAALAGYKYDGNLRFSELYMKLNPESSSYDYSKVLEEHGGYRAPDHPSDPERISKMREFQKYLLSVAGEFHWGYELLRNGSYDKAIRVLKEVRALFPDSYQVANDLALAYHLKYLQQQAPEDQRFQVQLIDYFVDLREKLREADLLKNAIACYRDALRINPRDTGVQSNLAVALAQEKQPGDLEEADQLISYSLIKEPENAVFLNHKAIVEYYRTKTESTPNLDQVRDLFANAAKTQNLAAEYNLAVLEMETGNKDQAAENFRTYLQHDDSSKWADHARELLSTAGITVTPPHPPADSEPPSILGVQLDDNRADVVAHLNQPERSEKAETARQESGELLYYDSLGIVVVLSQGKVIAIHVTKPDSGATLIADLKKSDEAQEVNGLEIGATPQELIKAWGDPMQPPAMDPSTSQKMYNYGNSRFRLDVSVDLVEFRVKRIVLRKV